MECESEIVSVSILSQDHDSAILKRIQSRSKKIFKIVYPKKKLIAYQGYNRKEKSLEELSKRFIRCLIQFDEKIISLDQITQELGVERRRIYDIINILESLQVVKRKCKNQYSWSGFKTIYKTIEEYSKTSMNIPQTNHKREKSLEVLSAGFIKLFMQNKSIWTLEEAAKQLGSEPDENKLKTKVRRLYDIANVLKSIGLIQKTHLKSTNKPAFQWVGCTGLEQFQKGLSQKENQQPVAIATNTGTAKANTNNIGIESIIEQYMEYMLQQKQLTDKKLLTEQKTPYNINVLKSKDHVITPKLRRTCTIIPPRLTTPKKSILLITPKKKQNSRDVTPSKQVIGSLIGKFNQNC